MSCTNCYNGCAEIVSDQCVKYTGVDVPLLGIQNGDTLATVENAIISFVTPFLNGSGIKPLIDLDIICDVVRQYIPTCVECNGFNLNDILSAIIKAVCDLQLQINDVVVDIAVIEADYEVDCLEGVTANAGTHDVLQAVITTLCEVQSDLATLALDVSEQYIRVNEINDYIAAYLNANASQLVNAKMIPFVALEFYGDLVGKFDSTGAGIGAWKDINLCNGNNGTPDKRGRVAVCAIQDMAGGALDPEVDPAVNPSYNPNYVIDSTYGFNFTTLNVTQLPSHAHPNTVFTQLQQNPHNHGLSNGASIGSGPYGAAGGTRIGLGDLSYTQDGFADITVTTFINNGFTGGSQPHTNVQPVYPCYYIMYIPI